MLAGGRQHGFRGRHDAFGKRHGGTFSDQAAFCGWRHLPFLWPYDTFFGGLHGAKVLGAAPQLLRRHHDRRAAT